ncbi:MAG: hemerythrin domain-containing protein [Burkholderiales bacterium]|nr:hemerythrin domain-containing protein [Burkholderiales bacterium]
MVPAKGGGLLQLFQHAHHRVEGHLIDFREELERGRPGAELLAHAATDLNQHMFVEEKFLFPLLSEKLAAVVAGLQDEHGRVWDLMGELRELLRRDAGRETLQAGTARLMGALTAHNTAEDLGVYPDLLALLGPSRAQALLMEVERVEVPRGWMCAARAWPTRVLPGAEAGFPLRRDE